MSDDYGRVIPAKNVKSKNDTCKFIKLTHNIHNYNDLYNNTRII